MDEQLVTITKEEYESLVKSERQLDHLHSNGVDNWGGYSHYFWEDEDGDA